MSDGPPFLPDSLFLAPCARYRTGHFPNDLSVVNLKGYMTHFAKDVAGFGRYQQLQLVDNTLHSLE